jgi:cysteine desulfurase/selenocysteine lyase
MLDLATVRDEFPVAHAAAYLNHAAVGPIPRRAQRAMITAIEDYMLVRRAGWDEGIQRVRAQAASLINARSDQIAFIKNTSEGISIAANGIGWRAGENAIAVAGDFPSVRYAWRNLASQGVETRLVSPRDGRVHPDDIRASIDDRTRAVAISTVQFASGFRCDLAAIGALCRERDVLFVADGIQSLGALGCDVRATGIDVLAADAHKWLMGPPGIGILFVSDRALERLAVRTVGWLSVREPFRFPAEIDLLPDARRFEPGTENSIGVFGLGGTLELILEIGVEAIEGRVLGLTDMLCEGLARKGYRVVSPRGERERSGIVIFSHATRDTQVLADRLAAAGVVVSVRAGGIRVSPHYYNSEEEIELLLHTLP